MNENLVMEEDTIYEVDPVCMRKKGMDKKSDEVEKQEPMKKVEYLRKEDVMFVCMILLVFFFINPIVHL